MRKALLIGFAAAASLVGQDTKVIQVKHRPAEALARLVAAGPIEVRPSREFNTITLNSSSQERLKVAEAIIQQYDTPRRQAEFVLRVIEASSTSQGPNDAADLVPAELKSLLRYQRYWQRDSAFLRGLESERLRIVLGGNLTGSMDFRLREAQPPVLELRLEILGPGGLIRTKEGEVTHTPTLLETSTSVKNGETVVLGASKMQGGGNALIVLLTAKVLP